MRHPRHPLPAGLAGSAVASLVASFIASFTPVATAQTSQVILFGTADVAGRFVRNGSIGRQYSEVSGSNSTSKLGFRGTEDLGDGLSAGFLLEGAVAVDTGVSGASTPANQFFNRRATVNLASRTWGEFRLGRDWAPTHLTWSGFDPFITLGIAGANTFRSTSASRVLGQAFTTAAETAAANPTIQVSNAIEYFTPEWNGLYAQVIATAAEGGTPATGGTSTRGARAGYSAKGLELGAAALVTRNAAGGDRFNDIVYGAAYDFGYLKIAVAERNWQFRTDRQNNTLVALSAPLGNGLAKLSWLRANQSGATAALDANDATLLGAGYVYNLSKRTAVYAHGSRIWNRGGASFAVAGGPAVSGSATATNYFGGQRSTAYEFGLRHNF